MIPQRPNPDDVLRRMKTADEQAARGKLVIFFGAAPGVGKTYAMLEAARLEREQGRDVVVGVVETHGRYETASLLLGLEILPRHKLSYRGIVLEEFNLDAVLARKPGLVLVDELAHTNAPGARHPKRWQDVDELLDAGIDIFTTLNVQHLESLNDVIAQITGVTVKETVPDSVFAKAHEARLVDLPTDELLQRLREGKIYVPEQAGRAIENFFREGNLIALRQLALRHTADRVDAQIQEYRRSQGIEHTWAVSERILVCVSWSPHSEGLIRATYRMAQSLHAPWYALYVEPPSRITLSIRDRTQLTRNLRLAEELGAEVITQSAEHPAQEIIAFARARNITRIVAGKPRLFSIRDRVLGSFLDELIRLSGGIDIIVTTGESEPSPRERETTSSPVATSSFRDYAIATGVVSIMTLLGWMLFGRNQPADVAMLYLLGGVLVSMANGYGPSIFVAALSVIAFNFFFIPPYLSLSVADLRHTVTFAVMFFVSVVTSALTQRLRAQTKAARGREQRASMLYSLTRDLTHTSGKEALMAVAARHVSDAFDGMIAIYTRGTGPGDELKEVVRHGNDSQLLAREHGIIHWVWDNRKAAGLGTHTLPGAKGLYLPLKGSPGMLGVLAVIPRDPARFATDAEQPRILETLAGQVAAALERAELAEQMERARFDAERETMRATLLSSVSHDLRTPLASIMGSATTLLEEEPSTETNGRRELLATIYEEAQRLNRLVQNLLSMTRLEAGAIEIKREVQPIEEVIGVALSRLEDRLALRTVETRLPEELVPVKIDALLMEQVFINLLENALKYAPPPSPIEITATTQGNDIIVEVADRGPGIPPGSEERIFEKFYRVKPKNAIGGVGLGLAICRAILQAHNGRIWAENRPGGGASFKFTLAAAKRPRTTDQETACLLAAIS